MNSTGRSVGIGVLVVAGLIGVRIWLTLSKFPNTAPSEPNLLQKEVQKTQDMADALTASIKEMEEGKHLRPVITLPTVEGWTHGEVEPFETVEDGFSIPFEHTSGAGVSFYQFTRGHSEILDDIMQPMVASELDRAKKEIEEIAGKGIAWDTAKLVKSEVVQLGDSTQRAHWAQYELGFEGKTLISEIYLWTRENQFLKLRYTAPASEAPSNEANLKALLTAFGNAEKAPPPVLRLKGPAGK